MGFANRVSRSLHDEHLATVALMERLEHIIARSGKDDPPDAADPLAARLLADLSIGMASELDRHFTFEETRLFTFLAAAGHEAIGAHLTEEHVAIRPVAAALGKLAGDIRTLGFDPARWKAFRRLGHELGERLAMHIQMEEMALLPALDENMEPGIAAELYEEYAGTA